MMKVSARYILSVFVFFLFTFFFQIYSLAAMDDWQKGFTLRLADEPTSRIDASLTQLRDTGTNFLTITPGWNTDSTTSSNVSRKSRTPSDDLLRYTINKAHSLGFKVMLKPHLDPKGGSWRANIDPSNKATFFANYSTMMLNYARLAQETGTEQLCIGAELIKLTQNLSNEHYWRALISDIRAIYSGKLTYSANADSGRLNETNLPFGDALDVIGLSVYRPLSSTNNPTVESMITRWASIEQTYVLPTYQRYNKPIIFTEIGYRSVNGASTRPWDYGYNNNVDQQEQSDLYKAFFEFWKDKSYFVGVHFWEWLPDVNAGGPSDKGYTPQNKLAQQTVKTYFGSPVTLSLPPDNGLPPINTAPSVTTIPSPTSPSTDPVIVPLPPEPPAPSEPSESTHEIIINTPKDNSTMSGEKKLKIYFEDLDLDEYTSYYNVDNMGEINMENDSTGSYKQSKIDFDKWTWNGKGPYNVLITTRDLTGVILDQANLTLFIKE